MLPVTQDLDAYRGDSWSQSFRLLRDTTPVNLTGATVKSEARAPNGTRTVLTVQVEDATQGKIRLALPSGSLPAGRYDYDVETTETGGVITTWIKGKLIVSRDVTNELS